MKLTTAQKWLRTIAWLHRNFPGQYPIIVRSVPLKKNHGYTAFCDSQFMIKIHSKQSFSLKLDTLLHEYAHCLTWFGAETDEDHSGELGLAWVRIYRTFLEWDFGKKETK